jgi:ribosome maturation protein SDO1
MRPVKTFDKDKLSLNLAKLKKNGEHFEVIIDPDKVVDYKNKKIDEREVLLYEKVFSDAKKGFEASSELIENVFGTTDAYSVATIILQTGEIQFTQEYREQKRKEKLNRILDIIVRNAIDPRSGLPHPRNRIESAIDEARIKVDDLKEPEDQIKDVLSKLKPILPIKFAVKEIQIKIGSNYGAKAYATVQSFGKILKDEWLNDGSWLCNVEIPAGMQNEFFDALNKLTQGSVESKVISER